MRRFTVSARALQTSIFRSIQEPHIRDRSNTLYAASASSAVKHVSNAPRSTVVELSRICCSCVRFQVGAAGIFRAVVRSIPSLFFKRIPQMIEPGLLLLSLTQNFPYAQVAAKFILATAAPDEPGDQH